MMFEMMAQMTQPTIEVTSPPTTLPQNFVPGRIQSPIPERRAVTTTMVNASPV